MEGHILANSLVSLKGTDLRIIYALFCKTNIGDLLSSKTKDFFIKEERDHFNKHLEAEVRKLEKVSDHELQVTLFLELTKLLNLRGTKYSLEREIVDQSTNIVNEVYFQYKKQDKKFREYAGKNPNSTNLQQMVQFQMGKIFREIDDSFKDFSIQDQQKFAAQVNEYILSLPEDKQNKIKEKLGINDLTDGMVRKTIATSGTSIVFAIIVEVSGFAFYSTATSLFASIAGLIGITLPFGFYTGLTSTIAVLANPLFIIPLLLGGGVLLINHQNKSLRTKLLPVIIMQIALPYMSTGSSYSLFDDFITEWERRYGQFEKLHMEINEVKSQQQEMHENIANEKQQINNLIAQINSNELLILNEKKNIKSSLKLTTLEDLTVNDSFNNHRIKYQNKLIEIKALQQSKKSSRSSTGFFQRIGNSISNFSTTIDIRDQEKETDKLLDMMVDDVLYSDSTFKMNERERVKLLKESNNALKTDNKNAIENKEDFEKRLSSLNRKFIKVEKQMNQLEKDHYGLKDLFLG